MWEILATVMRGMPSTDPEHMALDAAVHDAFPGVACQTYTCSGLDFETKTYWYKEGTDHELLSEYKARQVRRFVEGWKRGYWTDRAMPDREFKGIQLRPLQ